MLSVFLITFPFFALVACGFAATWRGLLVDSAIPGLNSFVLYFALPCMLYRFGAQTPVAQLLDAGVAGVYLLCAVTMVAMTVALTRRRQGWNNAAFGALVAAFPNTGFMGVPMLLALLGPHSAGPIVIALVIDMVFTSSLCIALSRLGLSQGQGPMAAAGAALRGIAANPMPWAIALGCVASWMGWQLPQPVDQVVGMLAAAASPVALFTIGAVLARSQRNSHERVAVRDYLPIALAKLLVHPVLVWCAGTLAIRWGWPLSPQALVTLVLLAALPSASNVALLTERFGAHGGRVARIILVSTSLAFVSFSLAVAWLL